MSNRPFILITNDDGVYAPGIKHLTAALAPFYDVAVVAPASEQSAVSLSITIRHPLKIDQVEWAIANKSIWSVNGTPADCVKLALKVILPKTPDLIVSGINRGSNAGRNVLYSGTIAGVIEGIMHNIPGIAFSMSDYLNPNFALAEIHIPSIINYVVAHPLPLGTFLNVNFPSHMERGIKGVRLARQGKEYWAENPVEREHPAEGHSYYWLGIELAQFQEESDSDISLLKEGYATVVPIQIRDLTHHGFIDQYRNHFESTIKNSFAEANEISENR